jgi:excisionase family DNA binding protein
MVRDQDFGIVRLRAYGTYDFKITNPKIFLKEVAGTDDHFKLDEFSDVMRSRLVSVFSESVAQAKIPALDVASRYSEIGEALLPVINAAISAKYGIEMTTFVVENVSVPEEVEKAIDQRSSMGAVGNLNDYVKFQMAQGLGSGQGGGGTAGAAAELAMGFGMAQQMMNQPGGMFGAQATPSAAPSAAPPVAPSTGGGLPELLSPADAATALGVSEADVMAALGDGSLKGKKIGSAFRVTRQALEEFLKS